MHIHQSHAPCLICSGPAMWLFISQATTNLPSICRMDQHDAVKAVAATYRPYILAAVEHQAELQLSSEAHLHALLGRLQPTHVFGVQAAALEPEDSGREPDHHNCSMAWAYRAKELAGLPCKMSLVLVCGDRHTMQCSQHLPPKLQGLEALACGLAKTLFLENRPAYGTTIKLQPGSETPERLGWAAASSGEQSIAIHSDGQLFAERLAPARLARSRQLAPQPASTSIVIGGAKGLGLSLSWQLVEEEGCSCIVLSSRSPSLSHNLLAEMARSGTAVFVVQSDAASTQQSMHVCSWAHNHLPPVNVHAHAAGVAGYDPIPDMSPTSFAAVVAPKTAVATATLDCELFVEASLYFSSISAVWSQSGGAHYSAANCYLDAVATAQQSAGCPAVAVAFGPFIDTGMASGVGDSMAAVGLHGLHSSHIKHSFAMAGVVPQLISACISTGRFARVNTARGGWSLIEDIDTVSSVREEAFPCQSELRQGAPALPKTTDVPALLSLLTATAEDVLGTALLPGEALCWANWTLGSLQELHCLIPPPHFSFQGPLS